MPTVQYTHTTFLQARNILAARLGEPGKYRWSDEKLKEYLVEAIRVFSATTGYFRDEDTFHTQDGVAFYDLSTDTDHGMRSYDVYDRTLIGQMQYHLQQPYDPIDGTGMQSELWSFDAVVSALQRARDMFLAATGSYLEHSLTFVGMPTYHDLAENVLGVRRAHWVSIEGAYSPLQPNDEFMAEGMTRNWTNSPGTPRSYSIASSPNLTMEIIPPPNDVGSLDLLLMTLPNVLDPAAGASGTLMYVPNDFSWGVKYGALAILLRQEGPGNDPIRAEFCEEMWNFALELEGVAPIVMWCEVDGTRILPSPLRKLDNTRYGWQGKTRGTPDVLAIESDMIALCPVPDGNTHSVRVGLVRNAVVPVADGDYVQVAREDMDAIYGWAMQIATFELGGASLASARTAAATMLERSRRYNDYRLMQSAYLAELIRQSSDQYRPVSRPRMPDAVPSDDGNDTSSSRQSRMRSTIMRRRKRLGGR